MEVKKILLVEDDQLVGRGLTLGLRQEGFEVVMASTLEDARKRLNDAEFELVLLDINLPDGDGFSFCSYIRENYSKLPILMLTARTDESSAVRGLDTGAEDYIRKPVGVRELVARMQRVLGDAHEYTYKGLKLDTRDRSVSVDGKQIDLSRREFEILAVLVRCAERVVSRDQILDSFDKEGNIGDRSIDSHLSRLRSKLKAAGLEAIQITPVYGLGYKLEKRN